jgi:hypothetical protein
MIRARLRKACAYLRATGIDEGHKANSALVYVAYVCLVETPSLSAIRTRRIKDFARTFSLYSRSIGTRRALGE